MKEFKYIIYKLTRDDGKIYIGTTNTTKINNRMYCHKRSKRFLNHTFKCEIIELSKNISLLEKEEYYVNLYNSYKNGLNKTKSGKGYGHNSIKFTTLGYKFTQETKNKISKSQKKDIKKILKSKKNLVIIENLDEKMKKIEKWCVKKEKVYNIILNYQNLM